MSTSAPQPLTAAQEHFDPAGRAQAEAAFLDANPSFRETAVLDELRASEYGRLDARGDVYLDYTGGSLYAESQLEEHLRLLRETVYGNPHSVNPTSSAATVLVEQARAAVLRYFDAPESEYACIFTPNATGALRLVGEAYPFGPAGPVPGDVRQPQLGQRHPRVRPGEGSADGVRAARGARPPRRRRAARALPRRRRARTATTSSPIPAQSNFSGVKHPLEWIALGPGARLGRDRRLGRVRADQPARPVGVEAGLRPDLVLQAVRLPDRPRRAARPARGAGAAAAPLVQRRHRGRGEHPGRAGRAAVRPRAVRGRHGQLPRHPGDRDRPAPHRADRHRHDLAPGGGARDVAARGAAAAAALGRQPGDLRLRADDVGSPRRHDRVQLPAPGRPRGRRALRRRRRGARTASRSGPAASATPAPARPRSRSRATR